MELPGTSVAQSARMRERTASSSPSIKAQPTPSEPQKETDQAPKPAAESNEGLDKYDISTIACTD